MFGPLPIVDPTDSDYETISMLSVTTLQSDVSRLRSGTLVTHQHEKSAENQVRFFSQSGANLHVAQSQGESIDKQVTKLTLVSDQPARSVTPTPEQVQSQISPSAVEGKSDDCAEYGF